MHREQQGRVRQHRGQQNLASVCTRNAALFTFASFTSIFPPPAPPFTDTHINRSRRKPSAHFICAASRFPERPPAIRSGRPMIVFTMALMIGACTLLMEIQIGGHHIELPGQVRLQTARDARALKLRARVELTA